MLKIRKENDWIEPTAIFFSQLISSSGVSILTGGQYHVLQIGSILNQSTKILCKTKTIQRFWNISSKKLHGRRICLVSNTNLLLINDYLYYCTYILLCWRNYTATMWMLLTANLQLRHSVDGFQRPQNSQNPQWLHGVEVFTSTAFTEQENSRTTHVSSQDFLYI